MEKEEWVSNSFYPNPGEGEIDHVQHLTAAYALRTTSFSLSIYPPGGELPGTAQCLSISM